jgi:hypothetical protein
LLLSCYPHEIILHSIYGHLLKGIAEKPVEAMDNLLDSNAPPAHPEIKKEPAVSS